MKPAKRLPIEITKREPPKKVIANYNHVETDEEFRDRLAKEGKIFPEWCRFSDDFDRYALGHWGAQRKFIRVIKER